MEKNEKDIKNYAGKGFHLRSKFMGVLEKLLKRIKFSKKRVPISNGFFYPDYLKFISEEMTLKCSGGYGNTVIQRKLMITLGFLGKINV